MMEGEEEEGECVKEETHLERSTDSLTETAEELAPWGSNDDITLENQTPQEPGRELTLDPQGLEVKTLPLMSPARGQKVSPGQQRRNQELALAVKELQLQLREKEEEMGRQRRTAEREAREREEQVDRLEREAQRWEKEKWELLKRARDGAERALHLQTQLGVKETQLRSLQADLGRTRDEMMSVKSANTSLRALLSELRAPKPTKEVGVQASLGPGTLRRNTSMELAVQELPRPSSSDMERGVDFRASTTNLDRGVNHRISNCSAMSEGWSMTQGAWDRSSERWGREQSVTSVTSSVYERGSREGTPTQSPNSSQRGKKKKRGPLFGKLRKSAGKRGSTPTILDGVDMSQSSLVQGHGQAPIAFPYHTRVAVETQEHWRVLQEAKRVPFNLWNGSTIVAWVSTGLGMSQYVSAVREHITTGNALLALSDSDMDKKLGVSNPLHRRKLRLAIEECRRPDRVRYPLAGRIDCGWLAEVWISDIGLPQHSDLITTHLVDGRVLESLTKDDLKKYFKFKKFEVMSFLSGVELLRMHDYNREMIEEVRASQQRRSSPQNPLYWTNRDVGDWIRDIQLVDYATNLLQTGVHGAMLFLEKDKFSSDQLGQVLQLPSGKHVARKHLAQQMARLFRDEGTENLYMSQQNSMISFQSNMGGNSPLSPPFSGSLYRAGSSPSLNQTGSPTERLSLEDRIRHSLRESALRSVMLSPRTPSPSSSPTSQFSHPPSPHLPSAPSPLTQTKASSTTV
ncbi:Kazrin-A [Geodia barretti]|nr:Kazrin-A [Geodia barretti]